LLHQSQSIRLVNGNKDGNIIYFFIISIKFRSCQARQVNHCRRAEQLSKLLLLGVDLILILIPNFQVPNFNPLILISH
jgi:hypothetical protein